MIFLASQLRSGFGVLSKVYHWFDRPIKSKKHNDDQGLAVLTKSATGGKQRKAAIDRGRSLTLRALHRAAPNGAHMDCQS